ncbi:YadA-like family protein [Croceicoccus sp. YJ47]|uniref:YadA-like family protein n=1 Tax=Croceicoccus sp. YJ47 TaxID=2798724 RepID=UPI001922F544|nr:YadA-like family protein [Croceicoccus sp. YJ47]QQN73519.1 YadA-like family protein [Croceicoccus sp. YJ47]
MSNGGTITNDVTLVGADDTAPVALHNVANGTLANDAVNVGQMEAAMAGTMAYADARLTEALDYTDARFAALDYDLREARKESFAGTAGAMAMAGLPQVVEAGTRMIAGAVGHFRGQTAFAIGASLAANEGRTVFKLNGSIDTKGYAGVSTGAGFAF